jgi:hypothetical protein
VADKAAAPIIFVVVVADINFNFFYFNVLIKIKLKLNKIIIHNFKKKKKEKLIFEIILFMQNKYIIIFLHILANTCTNTLNFRGLKIVFIFSQIFE